MVTTQWPNHAVATEGSRQTDAPREAVLVGGPKQTEALYLNSRCDPLFLSSQDCDVHRSGVQLLEYRWVSAHGCITCHVNYALGTRFLEPASRLPHRGESASSGECLVSFGWRRTQSRMIHASLMSLKTWPPTKGPCLLYNNMIGSPGHYTRLCLITGAIG
jgi:hypothetical protein